ncbi:MAG: S41 family peptidase [Oscillospiraceae bacterium]|nr:S41 family peptidase [Oscillospiraceae bacterium]
MKFAHKLISYVLVAALASFLTMAAFGGRPAEEYDKLDALEELIETYFIGESDRTAMEDAAAAAMVNSLGDKWSYYMTAKDYQAYLEQMQNAYVGVGITITLAEDGSGFEVIKVDAGGSAEEAGILAGDVIVGIEGQSTEGMTTTDARDLVRGKEGTQVALTIRRGTQTLELSVTRKTVKVPVTEAQLLNGGMGLITIYNFDDRCADETIASIEKLLDQGATALIFDVRGNPGGYKHELVKLLDYLLPEGPLFRSEDYKGKVEVDESDARYLDIPMAVLVDGASYSAAEFFAAALDEYDAAVIIGEKTTGKGYFQSSFELDDGSAVGLSIGKYTTPNGVSLADVGITPEILIELDEETAFKIYAGTLAPEEDPHIQSAVEAMKTNTASN